MDECGFRSRAVTDLCVYERGFQRAIVRALDHQNFPVASNQLYCEESSSLRDVHRRLALERRQRRRERRKHENAVLLSTGFRGLTADFRRPQPALRPER